MRRSSAGNRDIPQPSPKLGMPHWKASFSVPPKRQATPNRLQLSVTSFYDAVQKASGFFFVFYTGRRGGFCASFAAVFACFIHQLLKLIEVGGAWICLVADNECRRSINKYALTD